MVFKLLTYTGLLFYNTKKSLFRNTRRDYNLTGLVEIHHIIPRQFKRHPTIIFSKYDIENGYNFVFLPNKKGENVLNIHPDRPIHNNGHIEYNYYVKQRLDDIFNKIYQFDIIDTIISKENLQHLMCELNIELRQNMRHLDVPWF